MTFYIGLFVEGPCDVCHRPARWIEHRWDESARPDQLCDQCHSALAEEYQ